MKELKKEQLLQIEGGINFTGSLLGQIVKGISSIYEMSRAFGSAVRRIFSKKMCNI